MTNKEITNIKFATNEVDSLYLGDLLIWKRQEGEEDPNTKVRGDYLRGKFIANCPRAETYYCSTSSSSDTVNIYEYIDHETGNFEIKFEEGQTFNSFYASYGIEEIYEIPYNRFYYPNRLAQTFYRCTELKYINPNIFKYLDLTEISSFIAGTTKLESLDLRQLDASNLTNFNPDKFNSFRLTA